MAFTIEEKLACAERELGMRQRVYRTRVQDGRMKQADADREVALMAEIAADYRAQVPDLFKGGK